MLSIVLFISLGSVLCVTDLVGRRIPNVIVLPAILLGIVINGHILWVCLMAILGILLYQEKFWAGGDVKIVMMLGAFLGQRSVIVFCLSILAVLLGRISKKQQPYAPYAFLTGVLFLW